MATLRARQLAALARLWPEGFGCLPQRAAEVLAAVRKGADGLENAA